MSATPLTGYAPLNVTFTGTHPSFVSIDYIDYGDGTTGTSFSHTYAATGNAYAPKTYVYNTSYPSETRYCDMKNGIYVGSAYCGDGTIQNPNSSGQIVVCDS